MCYFVCVDYLYNCSGVISLHVIHLPDLTPKAPEGWEAGLWWLFESALLVWIWRKGL